MSRKTKIPRRIFLGSGAVGTAGLLVETQGPLQSLSLSEDKARPVFKLAGMSLPELRQRYHGEFFNTFLPFWEKYGIDREYGGFMCALDHDGTLVNGNKFHWFQGRGIWVYSFLYNHFGKVPHYLEIAKKAKDFLLKYFPQKDGWWAERVTREGRVLKPFSGDLFGMYFAAEGLQEYAYAAQDDEVREIAFKLFKKLVARMNQMDFRDPETGVPGVRSQGVWMVTLQTATQILKRWSDPEIAAIADQSVDAIINKHYNPEIGLNNETLNLDFSRPKEEATKCLIGHSLETLWMVMDEALRRKDQALYDNCVERVRHHLDVGWDYIYGGLGNWVNVGQGGYEWPIERPEETDLEFRPVGEYNWLKSSWSLDEVLIATMNIIEHRDFEWAVRYFGLAQDTFDKKFSLKRYRFPLFMIFTDRQMTFQPHSVRQENYHRPRQFMLNLLAIDRIIARGGGISEGL